MDWFFNLLPTLRSRLYAISAVMGVLMVGLVLLMLQGTRQQLDSLRSVYEERVVPLRALKVVSDAYAVNIVDTCHKVRNGVVGWEEGVKAVTDARSLVNNAWKRTWPMRGFSSGFLSSMNHTRPPGSSTSRSFTCRRPGLVNFNASPPSLCTVRTR